MERFSKSGFYGNVAFYPKAVHAVCGNGSLTGGVFWGRGRLYDLVSAEGDWGKGKMDRFLFEYQETVGFLRSHKKMIMVTVISTFLQRGSGVECENNEKA